MKRLLLPLLAAFALPTAVNANWFSGDIVEKNAIGEKTIVKSSTVFVEKNETLGDYLFEQTYYRDDYKKTLNKYKSLVLEKENKYADCISKYKKDSYYCKDFPKDISFWKEEVITWEGYLEGKENFVKNITQTIEKHNKDTILFSIVKYTPIYVDLNGKKFIQSETEVSCENPSIDFKDLGLVNDSRNSLERKICQRHAKF